MAEDLVASAYWQCQECGYEDYCKSTPVDREAFYWRVEQRGPSKCPRCKSTGFLPVGY